MAFDEDAQALKSISRSCRGLSWEKSALDSGPGVENRLASNLKPENLGGGPLPRLGQCRETIRDVGEPSVGATESWQRLRVIIIIVIITIIIIIVIIIFTTNILFIWLYTFDKFRA